MSPLVINVVLAMRRTFPVHPAERTFFESRATSLSGHKQPRQSYMFELASDLYSENKKPPTR